MATFTDTNTSDTASNFTATINWGDGTTTAGTVMAVNGGGLVGGYAVSGTHTYTKSGQYPVMATLADDAPGTATATANSAALVGYILTSKPETVQGGAGDNTVIATSGTLVPGDVIDGGGGTLVLQGAGTFDLRLPTTLTDIQTITAQEGQPAFSNSSQIFGAQSQFIFLRNGLDATVDVSPATTTNPSNPEPPTITIIGAHNADVINLGSGNDVVTIGDARESVNGGTGNDLIQITGATIGATIDGGTGYSTLQVTGGGTMAMGSNITDISTVLLSAAASAYDFTANAISGLTVNDASAATSDTLWRAAPTKH